MTPREAQKLVGKRIEWQEFIGPGRGVIQLFRQRCGDLQEVSGKNARVSGDWLWIPGMKNLKEVSNG